MGLKSKQENKFQDRLMKYLDNKTQYLHNTYKIVVTYVL